jgi:nucleoside-diphosphate-sugar epimerase
VADRRCGVWSIITDPEPEVRVVIVGGTGNISRGITKSLLEHGHEVTFFNRGVMAGEIPASVRVIHGDRHDYAAFEARMQTERFDAAIDMICYTREEAESDVRAFRGVKQFIHTSTVAVFGGRLAETPTDEDSPRNPVIPYGINKVAADEVLYAARDRGDFPLTVFMPAQTWGYQTSLVRQLGFGTRWLDRIRRGLPLLVAHDGQLIWPELHADDAGVAYGAALGRERCIGQTYILTRPGFSTWRDYHDQVGAALGKPITYVDAPAGWLIKSWPEGTKLLDWESRWNRIYRLDRIQRDIPEFRPRITLAAKIGEYVADLDRRGLIEDALADDTEDRLIARVEAL